MVLFELRVKESCIGFYAGVSGRGCWVGAWVSEGTLADPIPYFLIPPSHPPKKKETKIKQLLLSDSILFLTLCLGVSVWILIWTRQDIRWPPYSQLISHVLVQPCYKIPLHYSHPTGPFYKGMGSVRTPCCSPPQKPPRRLFFYVTDLSLINSVSLL